ncbi:MAG: 50S ribosomal protein L22 [Deltaproteobacteria bacterium CG11_big_fil_rev_8_21_14_0_20_45_16]|nr:MAG: 50S ribosomal protein L22 [Deltaproteobacteria bacterium CG11_big_fil_rev_8_21_14_0_20_45_16]
MEASATLRNIRISAKKMGPVLKLVRGRSLNQALAQLRFTPRKGAKILQKVMESARANAFEKQIDVDNLKVKTVFVNKGPTMFRIMTRQRGMAHRIQKRMSHVTVVLED